MKYRTGLATLLFSAALMSAPALTSIAFAHDGGDGTTKYCQHQTLSKEHWELLRTAMQKSREALDGSIQLE